MPIVLTTTAIATYSNARETEPLHGQLTNKLKSNWQVCSRIQPSASVTILENHVTQLVSIDVACN